MERNRDKLATNYPGPPTGGGGRGETGAFCPGPHLVGGPRQGTLLSLSYTCTKDRNTLIEQSP